jgi:transaldolase
LLEEKGNQSLLGKIAIANSRVAFAESLKIFAEPRWKKLQQAGARQQRLLWASTGTKNPNYPDTLYIDELIGPDSVNTVPPATLEAFLDHGTIQQTINKNTQQAFADLAALEDLGIHLQDVTATLQKDGVLLFEQAFKKLLQAIEQKITDLT